MSNKFVRNKLKRLKKELIGKVFILKNFDEPLTIIDVKIKMESTPTTYVKFRYSNIHETVEVWYRYSEVKRDHVRNILKIGKWGTYLGQYGHRDDFDLYVYNVWKHMHERCNSHKVYEHASICKEWLGYSNFFKWTRSKESNYIPGDDQQIDKDILQWGFENKVYSPSTCVFIPTYLNKYLSGLSKRTRDRSNDKGVPLRLNAASLYITAKDVKYKKNLYNYCRYYILDKLIKYYLDNKKISVMVSNRLNLINLDINKILTIGLNKKDLPNELKKKLDLFIDKELNNLKIREK